MSVRRLAEDHRQPGGFAFNRAMTAEAKKWLKKYPKGREQSAVIPLLMLAQEQEGWVSKAAIEHVSDMLQMPKIRVLEVATFYTQFQLSPVGSKAHIQVCGTTPCMLRGSDELIRVCKSRIHEEPFHLNEAGTLSWEEVECQGGCVNAPMVMIFKDAYEDLTPERLEEIIDAFDAGKGDTIKPGPQNGRTFSAPASGLTTLMDKAAIEKKVRVSSPAKSKAAPKPAAKTAKVAAIAASPALDDRNRPAAAEKPAEPDDLKMISGVGPKIEGILHSLGIFTFKQIAAWKKAEREWVDNYLKFKGRIEREDWAKQAKALAKGGRDEYVRVFGKEPR
ncbi:MAG: NADH-quinone oxidoreductase subunit NuoE [Notoacmeibacter sp.]|nr:NADH-quinone oxidoreductase subunit NuoE [Notoacmeibacter sp.]